MTNTSLHRSFFPRVDIACKTHIAMADTDKQAGEFELPRIYDFPPFFTEQPNLDTYQSQLEQWKDVIMKYCEHHKVWALSIVGKPINSENNDAEDEFLADDYELNEIDSLRMTNNSSKSSDFSIFKNDKIKRTASNEFIAKIYDYLIEQKSAEWIDPKSRNHGILIYWHSLEEWSQLLYDWIDNTGQQGTILTVYELRRGDLALNREFYGMNYHMMVRVLEKLVKQGKATIMKDDENNIGGVKFGGV